MDGLRGMDSEKALEEVKSVLAEEPGMIYDTYDFIEEDFKEEVEEIDARVLGLIDQWFTEPVLNTWYLLLDESADAINESWERTVYDVYVSDLRGLFPFDPLSDDEVSYDDFVSFF